MKKLILILTSLIGLKSTFAASIEYTCDRPTVQHSELSIMLDTGITMATVVTIDSNKDLHLYTAHVEKSIREQLSQSLLKEPIIMVGTTDQSEVMSGYSIYTKSISVVLMQQTPGQKGTLSVYLTENNKVSVYSCNLK